MPGARAVLRRVVELGGTACYNDIQEHFACHRETPTPRGRIGGTLTSVRVVGRRIGPEKMTRLLSTTASTGSSPPSRTASSWRSFSLTSVPTFYAKRWPPPAVSELLRGGH